MRVPGRVVALFAVSALLLAGAAGYRLLRAKQSDTPHRPSTFTPPATSVNRGVPVRSAGCGSALRSPVGESLQVHGRDALVWGPDGYDAERAWPLVLVFHGWYTDAKAFAAWFAMERFVDGAAFTVYPNARGGIWDLRGESDLDFVDETIESVAASYCIDRSRVLAFGFSYGAKFVYHLGCARPGLVKAIAVGDGSAGGASSGCGDLPLLATHRTVDVDEHYAWGVQAFAEWATASGCSPESDVVDPVHACRTRRGCRAPATFCEDTYVNPTWVPSWNHTVRDEYRALTWRWFQSLP